MSLPRGSVSFVADLDGVLVDSSPAVFAAWSHWADAHGIDPLATFALGHGLSTLDHLRAVAPGLATEAEAARIADLERAALGTVSAMPGAARLCEALRGARWAVVTSCPRDVAFARLAAAGLPGPTVLVGLEDVTRPKPEPEGFRRAARLLEAEAVLVVEDAPAGVRAARAAGAAVLGVATTHDAVDLGEADAVIADLTGLTVLSSPDGTVTVLAPVDTGAPR